MGIDTSLHEGILTITINRVDKKNSFTNAMYTQFWQAIEQAEHEDAVKVVMLKGHESIFSAGNDIMDFISVPMSVDHSPVFKLLRSISVLSKPIIAVVRGAAVGIGTTILLHCDMVYASEKAKFSMPFTQLGLCPEAASSLILPLTMGYQRAAELLLLGEMFDAQAAAHMGLVNQVLADDQVDAHAMVKAQKLVCLPQSSVRATKMLLKSHLKGSIANKLDEESTLFVHMSTQPQAKEAFSSFLEKRKPDFSSFNN